MISPGQAELTAGLGICLARLAGFEPATRCLEGSCSIRLSYRRLPTIVQDPDHAGDTSMTPL
jgi:hypothetical protein